MRTISTYNWKVCPIQGRQLKDVRSEDIFGDFRICRTYRSGGGYDKFDDIAYSRGITCRGDASLQFVVQLYGCHLRCPYCYVTKDGIFGEYKEYSTANMLLKFHDAYHEFGCGVFHLMGGAPALYIEHWPEILDWLNDSFIFHSDLLLSEKIYPRAVLKEINRLNTLYAVNIKGTTIKNYKENTGRNLPEHGEIFHENLDRIVDSGLNFYLTFTNPDKMYLEGYKNRLSERYGSWILHDSFVIDLVNYKALEEGNAF